MCTCSEEDGVEFICDTDASLGLSTDWFAPSPTPTDYTTPLGADEAIVDLTDPDTYDIVYDDNITECCISLWALVLSSIAQSGLSTSLTVGANGYIKIFVRIYTIEVGVKTRILKQ